MDVLPPLVAQRAERLKCLNTERERIMEWYLEEIAALEMKCLDTCNPLYEERGNIVAIDLDDKIEGIHKELGGKKEENGSKGDNDGNNEDDDDDDENDDKEDVMDVLPPPSSL